MRAAWNLARSGCGRRTTRTEIVRPLSDEEIAGGAALKTAENTARALPARLGKLGCFNVMALRCASSSTSVRSYAGR